MVNGYFFIKQLFFGDFHAILAEFINFKILNNGIGAILAGYWERIDNALTDAI